MARSPYPGTDSGTSGIPRITDHSHAKSFVGLVPMHIKRPERVQQDRPAMKLLDHLVGASNSQLDRAPSRGHQLGLVGWMTGRAVGVLPFKMRPA
jgi:hypothetical protein